MPKATGFRLYATFIFVSITCKRTKNNSQNIEYEKNVVDIF